MVMLRNVVHGVMSGSRFEVSHTKIFLRFQDLSRSQLGALSREQPIRMASTIHVPRDPNTLSNYNNFLTTHTTANFAINFEKKILNGNVILNLKSITDAETKEILLDTSHLDIHDIKVDGQASKWKLLSRFEPYGSILKIELEKGVQNAKSVEVDVRFEYASTL